MPKRKHSPQRPRHLMTEADKAKYCQNKRQKKPETRKKPQPVDKDVVNKLMEKDLIKELLDDLVNTAMQEDNWLSSKRLQDFEFAEDKDKEEAALVGYVDCASLITAIAKKLLADHNSNLPQSKVHVTYTGQVADDWADPTPTIHNDGYPEDVPDPRPRLLADRVCQDLRDLRHKDFKFDSLWNNPRLTRIRALGERIIRQSPHTLTPGNPVLILVFAFLPREILMDELQHEARISVPPGWYEESLGSFLAAFAGLQKISAERALEAFNALAKKLQGSTYLPIELPASSMGVVIEDVEGSDDLGEQALDRPGRVQSTAGLISTLPTVQDDARAVFIAAGLNDEDIDLSLAIETQGFDDAIEAEAAARQRFDESGYGDNSLDEEDAWNGQDSDEHDDSDFEDDSEVEDDSWNGSEDGEYVPQGIELEAMEE